MAKRISLKRFIEFQNDLRKFKALLGSNPDFKFGKNKPILGEKNSGSGIMGGHYFHQDMLVARRIFENKPNRHVDIGSRTDGFVAHVASFREIEVFDIRPFTNILKNIKFVQADLMKLDQEKVDSTDSVSSLHAIEHFGLGRYGDPLDPDGHLKGLESIYLLLKKHGKFYFSVPIGPQRIEYNAHRVFSVKYLLNLFEGKYEINHFSYVNDKGALFENATLSETNIAENFGCNYGCGIFEMTKK